MAFFTFTTISGSAATNDLVISVTNVLGSGATTLSIQNGYVAFTNVQGNTTVSPYTIANFKVDGIPSTVTGGSGVLNMTLDTFQTEGLGVKLQGATAIDATGATSSQIDAFISNNVGANAGSLQGSSVTASQFVSLKQAGLLATNSSTVDGVLALDATGATAAQMAQIVAGAVAGLIADEAISNATVLAADFGTLDSLLALDASNVVDGSGYAAGSSGTLLGLITTYADALDSVVNLSVDNTGVLALNATNAALLDKEIILATTTNSTAMANVITYKTSFAPASITSAQGATVAQITQIAGKFAAGAIATSLTLAGATAAQIDTLATNSQILANDVLTNATLTPAQFKSLALKVTDGNAVVDAATATTGQVDAILANLAKFATSTGVSNLTVSAEQWASLSNASQGTLSNATANGEVSIVAANAAIINASGFGKTLSILGSSGADFITGGTAANSVQGGMGKDSIVGGAGNDVLRGGNAADTIVGGAGADTIYGGKSGTVQTLTGDVSTAGVAGIDTFNLSASSINNITDLAFAGSTSGGAAQDIIVNAAGAVTTATAVNTWAATTASSNAGSLTITAADGSAIDVDAHLILGGLGLTLNGGDGANSITGSNWADVITGAAGNDTLDGYNGNDTMTGGAGADTMTGGNGYDVYNVDLGADTIADLTTGDTMIVYATATSGTATNVANFVATAATQNNGDAAADAVITGYTGGAYIDLSLATGASGWKVTAQVSGTEASTIIGTSFADSITGAAGNDVLTGGAGNDTIASGGGADTITGGLGADAMTAGGGVDKFVIGTGDTGITVATADSITSFTSATDKLALGLAGSTTSGVTFNYVEASGSVANFTAALSAANFALSGAAFVGSTAAQRYAFEWDGTNGYLFEDTNANGTADQVIVLVGQTGSTFAVGDIIATA